MTNITLPAAVLAVAAFICSNSPSQERSSDPAPASNAAAAQKAPDKDSVKREIVSLANDIWDAAQQGKKAFLEEVATDDFESTDISGKTQNKRQAIADVKEEKAIKSWAITEPDLASFDESSAVLKYVLTVSGSGGRTIKARITDTYVKKNGKWYIKSQQQTLMK